MKPLEFNNSLPVSPGWYWIKQGRSKAIVHVTEDGKDGLIVWTRGWLRVHDARKELGITAWAGPIPEPVEL